MRMEAKNSYFKRIAQSGNYKNITFSVANRHQRLMCSYIQEDDFFNQAVSHGPGNDALLHPVHA